MDRIRQQGFDRASRAALSTSDPAYCDATQPDDGDDKTMTPATLTALNDSIAHWTRLANGTSREGEWVGVNDCALCALFFGPSRSGGLIAHCVKCPVKERTGRTGCGGTPHEDFAVVLVLLEVEFRDANGERPSTEWVKRQPAFIEAAAKELAFLKSLLPSTQPQLTEIPCKESSEETTSETT